MWGDLKNCAGSPLNVCCLFVPVKQACCVFHNSLVFVIIVQKATNSMQRLLFVTFLCLENARAHITLVPSFGGEAGNYFQTSIKVRWWSCKAPQRAYFDVPPIKSHFNCLNDIAYCTLPIELPGPTWCGGQRNDDDQGSSTSWSSKCGSRR